MSGLVEICTELQKRGEGGSYCNTVIQFSSVTNVIVNGQKADYFQAQKQRY
jgi:hypothetical protein